MGQHNQLHLFLFLVFFLVLHLTFIGAKTVDIVSSEQVAGHIRTLCLLGLPCFSSLLSSFLVTSTSSPGFEDAANRWPDSCRPPALVLPLVSVPVSPSLLVAASITRGIELVRPVRALVVQRLVSRFASTAAVAISSCQT
ncbi:hypothetical protein F4824DRAFT_403616 [Ustulina deusta]|nr:hypothetical protein F4824DRAFT_403616 [Ustulina deusta]